MDRLTEKRDGQNVIPLRQDGKTIWALTSAGMGYKSTQFLYGNHADKLAEYEDAEEQGFLKILPVDIGSDVYFIPSKVNYELNVLNHHEENNRVYHQKVANIVFNDRGYYLECDKDSEYGTDHVLVDIFYQVTWFTTEEEAEQALAEMKEGAV